MLKTSEHRAEHKINQGDFDVKRERLVSASDNSLRCHEHFCHGDVRGKRSFFYHRNQRIGKRGERGAERLRQNDVPYYLRITHPDAIARFDLSGADAFKRGPHRFGGVRALIERKDENRRGNRVNHNSEIRQSVEHDIELHQNRRAASDPNVKPRNRFKDPHIGKLNQRDENSDYQRKRERNNCKRNRDFYSRNQNLKKRISQNVPKSFIHKFKYNEFSKNIQTIKVGNASFRFAAKRRFQTKRFIL